MPITSIDIHSHLNLPQFDADRDAIIATMKEEGLATITVGVDSKTSKEAVALANEHEHLFATIGIHPTDADEAFDERTFTALLGEKVVAIGECGLDYFRGLRGSGHEDTDYKDRQKSLFIQQIEFAQKCRLPLMLHCRPSKGTMDAYDEALDILAAYPGVTGDFHFFAGDIPTAARALDAGFTLSFDGPITFTHDYDDVIRFVPDDMLMAETDAPFAAPAPHRGKRGEPLFVRHIIARIAEIRGVEEEKLTAQLLANAKLVFGLKI